MTKLMLIECYFFQSYTTVSNTNPLSKLQFLDHLLHSTDLFKCYWWQNYTTVNNTDLYLSYFDLSYVFLGHYDSVQQGLTMYKLFLSIRITFNVLEIQTIAKICNNQTVNHKSGPKTICQ